MTETATSGARLRRSIVCPNCWRDFSPQNLRFISESPGLIGDPVMGPLEQLRFRPMRFDASGNALDPEDARCNRIACPACHIELPRVVLEIGQLPISVVGAPRSGKTNLLAAGMWGLAQHSSWYGFQVVDADPAFNTAIHQNESTLFTNSDASADVTLPKTDVGGVALYRAVRVAGNEEMMPRPAFFLTHRIGARLCRLMVLYDNAGEHFLPGAQEASFGSSTRHLERSKTLVMVFDPLQDQRFRSRFAPSHQSQENAAHQRQELLFTEVVARIRRLRALDPSAPIAIPVVIALTKADVWAEAALGENWPVLPAERDAESILRHLRELSGRLRDVMKGVAPEFEAVATALASDVWFVPVSALGTSPKKRSDGSYSILASEIRPRWAEMPFVLSLLLAEQAASRERG